jgi:hypothetical protein
MSQGCSAVGRLIYLETYEKKNNSWSGVKVRYLALLLKLAIGGLVGRWIVVLVGWLVGWPKVFGTGHIRDFFPTGTNCCFLRWNGKE